MLTDGDKRCSCGSGHETFGACMRAKRIQIDNIAGHAATRQFEADQQAYADARRQGIQPSSPMREDVNRAVRLANQTGTPWKGEAVTGRVRNG